MKLLKTILLAAVIVSVVSCKSKNALAFNDKLVGIQHELLDKVNKMQGDTTTDAAAKLKGVQDLARQKLTEIKAMATPEGGEGFKEAMQKDISGIIDTYDILLKIVSAKEDEEKIAPLKEEFNKWQEKLEKLDNEVQEEQRKFAKANNIMLKPQ